MKKIIFLLAVVAAFTLSSFKATAQSQMTITITSVEKTPDGNKVYFEIVTDTLKFLPGLLVSETYKNGRYDWGGNPFSYDVVTIGNITTGYFLDGPLQGNKKRYYMIMGWDSEGSLVFSPVFVYSK